MQIYRCVNHLGGETIADVSKFVLNIVTPTFGDARNSKFDAASQ